MSMTGITFQTGASIQRVIIEAQTVVILMEPTAKNKSPEKHSKYIKRQ
jgi:hypothetical protein